MTKRAIVTGSSRGIGAELERQLGEVGWEVLGISRSRGRTLDLSDPEAVATWARSEELRDFLAPASSIAFVHNAGMLGPVGAVGSGSQSDAIARAINVNVTAGIILSEAILLHRPAGVDTRIGLISSGAGRRPVEGWAVYCASKAAVDMFARTVAAEEPDQVRIAAIAPGVVDTAMQGEIRGADAFPTQDRFLELHRTGGLASPEDAASAVLELMAREDFGHDPLADVRDAG